MNEENDNLKITDEQSQSSAENKADLFSDIPSNDAQSGATENRSDFISDLYGNSALPVAPNSKKAFQRSFIISIIAVFLAIIMFVTGLLIGLNTGVKVSESDYAFLDKSKELRSVIKYIKDNYYEDIDEEKLLTYAEYGVVDNLDSYSYVTTFDEVISSTAGSDYKVGIYVDNTVAGEFCIMWVEPNSPAEKAGLKIGDKLVAVGYTASDLYNVEKTYISTVTALFSVKIKNVYIQVERNGVVIEEPFLVERSNLTATSVHAINDFNAVFGIDVESDIGYIAITDFTNSNVGNELKTAIDNFKASGKKKLILDLRNNGGGYGGILGEVGSYFIKNANGSGTTHIINHKYKDGSDNYVDTTGYNYIYKNTGYEYKIAVLVNGGTASASEALIGAMIGADTCELIGEKTYGKGIGQLTVSGEWSSIYSITYTAGYFYFLNDVSAYVDGATEPVYNIHNKGFTPHSSYRVSKGKSNILSTDAQFYKAVQYLVSLG